jgi:hypothetical protein
MSSDLTPYEPPAPRQATSGGLVPFGRDWKIARGFSDAEIEHVRRTRAIDHEIAEKRRRQYGEAVLGAAAINNANQLASTAQAGFAEFIAERDELIGRAKYQKSADDILNFADSLAPELGRVAAAEIQIQKRR